MGPTDGHWNVRRAPIHGCIRLKAISADHRQVSYPWISISNQEKAPSEAKMDLKQYYPRSIVDRLRASVGHVVYLRIQPSLVKLELSLLQAVYAENLVAASQALCDLDELVVGIKQIYGRLPEEMSEDVRELVSVSLDVFRDPVSNPHGPLNEESLRRLDEAIARNLRRASSLHALGLRLEPVVDVRPRRD
ncbi:hypothetical protein [Alcaligenes sp. WGS1538]|uniref:hypothetical protein n=1 Tax=Alcaligenes sp. WGS1538 TaxID=3366811 RepID=UPI00372D0023